MNLEEFENQQEENSEGFNPSEFSKTNYEVEKVEELIDIESGNVIDKQKLKPFDYIRALAKKLGQDIKEPNSSCKFCYGRGHVNYIPEGSNEMPIPCRCIYKKESFENEKKMPVATNRKQKRILNRISNKIAKRYAKSLKNKGKEEFEQKEENEHGS